MDDNAEVRKNYYNTIFFLKRHGLKAERKAAKLKKASQIEQQYQNLTYTEKKN